MHGAKLCNLVAVHVKVAQALAHLGIDLLEGGVVVPASYTDASVLEADYRAGKVHPSDLKPAIAEAINRIIEPVRLHFQQGEPKKLLEKVKKFNVTR